MAFPNTIAAGTNRIAQPVQVGPFKIGSAFYVVVTDSSNAVVRIFKSTDSGVTWSEKDSASEPAIGTVAFTSAVQNGTKIYVASVSAGLFWQVSVFDSGTDTWTSTTVSTNAASANYNAGCMAYRASDGSLIITDQVQPNPGVTSSVAYFLFDTVALTFGSYILIGNTSTISTNDNTNPFAVLNGSGYTHFILVYHDAIAGTFTLQQQSLSDGGSLGSLQSIATVPNIFMFAISSASDGTNLLVLIWDYTLGTPTITAYEAVSAGSPTWMNQTLTPSVTNIDAIGAAVSGGIFYLLLVSDDGAGNYTYALTSDSGGGFNPSYTTIGTDTDFDQYVSVLMVSGVPAFAFNGSATVYFGYVLTTPIPATAPIAAGAGALPLPAGIGTTCKYGRVLRCRSNPKRAMLVGNVVTFGGARS